MGVFKKLSNRRKWTLGHDHVLQLDKLKEWQLCNKPPDCMPPARNKLKGKTNTTVTSEPSPITSELSNYQYLQKQLFHFWTVNPPDFFFLWIKPKFWRGNVWQSFIWKHSIYKMCNYCSHKMHTVPLTYDLW